MRESQILEGGQLVLGAADEIVQRGGAQPGVRWADRLEGTPQPELALDADGQRLDAEQPLEVGLPGRPQPQLGAAGQLRDDGRGLLDAGLGDA